MEPTQSIFDRDALPPWGPLSPEYVDGPDPKFPPKDWLITSRKSPLEKQKHYDEWSKRLLARIAEILWPLYVPDKQVWRGKSVPWMTKLTQADLGTMGGLAQHLHQKPQSPLRPMTINTHLALFRIEDQDGGSDMFTNYSYYDGTQGAAVLEAMRDMAGLANDAKLGGIDIVLKSNLQRPRPMQMAIRFGVSDYHYHEAVTSISPSMCSGHCIQSCVCVGGAVEAAVGSLALTSDVKTAIGQWGVDIGDRRVFAGVHFPSDNLCSWIAFLRMADYVYTKPEAKQVMADAIVKQSEVFSRLKVLGATEAGKYHRAAIREVEFLASLTFDPDRPLSELHPK
jgi:hypothetical protein